MKKQLKAFSGELFFVALELADRFPFRIYDGSV